MNLFFLSTKAMIISCSLMLLSEPAFAQQEVVLPRGCTGFLTIQLENCTVLNHWRCEGMSDGFYRVSSFDETQTNTTERLMDGLSTLELVQGPNRNVTLFTDIDPESYDTLLNTGIDTYAAEVKLRSGGKLILEGVSILTGDSTVIDGIDLQAVESTSRLIHPSGQVREKTVMQYVMPSMPVWVPDRVVGSDRDDVLERFGPVDFVWPGEQGFMTPLPSVNCSLGLS